MTTAWCRSRSSNAAATTASPNTPPFAEPAIGREDERAFLVPGVDELEEQIGAAGRDRQVADFIDDQQRVAGKISYPLNEPSLPLCLGERGHDIRQRAEVDTLAGFDGFDTKRDGKMRFSGPGWTKEMHHIATTNKVQR